MLVLVKPIGKLFSQAYYHLTKVMKVNSYLKEFCANKTKWLYELDESLYYKNNLHLVKLSGAKFSSEISQMINSLMHV